MTSPLYTGLHDRQRPSGTGEENGLLGAKAWNGELALEIAGIGFLLKGLPRPLLASLLARFRLFVGSAGTSTREVALTVRVRPAVVHGHLEMEKGEQPEIYRLETRAHQGRLHIWSYAFAGWLDIQGNESEIHLCDSPVELPERSIENFLRVALAWLAARRGGFLLHAAGLVRKGRAHLFFGPSGSGKTTITRLSPGDLVLNDDCIVVAREGGSFVARGVPFKGSEAFGARDPGAFPIAGLFRLEKSRLVACERLGAARGTAEIASSVPFVSDRPEGLEGIFTTIDELVHSVPVFRLHFRLAPDFWRVIEETLRA